MLKHQVLMSVNQLMFRCL